MDRRTFLEVLGLGGATSVVSGCNGAPLEKIYAYLTPPEEIVPGTATYFATVCRACPAGCGVIVKTREARPIKLEGNPAHPVNRGALCPRGQAFIQGLYSAHRVQTPLRRSGDRQASVSWSAALAQVAARLKSARTFGLLTGLESGSFEELIADLKGGFPALQHVTHEPLGHASLARASEIAFDRREVPQIRLDHATYVLSLGADLLDTWVSPVRLARQWGERHGFGGIGRRLELDYLGPRRNLTANAADRFRPIPPHAAGPIAAELLRRVHQRRAASLDVELRPVVAQLVQRVTAGAPRPAGLDSGELDRISERLLRERAPVVLHGGPETATSEATATHLAVLLIDFLLGAIGTSLHYGGRTALSKIDPTRDALTLIDRAASGKLDVLLIYGTNPAYSLPAAFEAARKLRAAPCVVALAAEHDETTELASVVLPVHHPLEAWGDFEVDDATLGLMQPVRAPLHDSRHAGDVLLDLARRSGRETRHDEYKKYVAARWASRRLPDLEEALTVGGYFATVPSSQPASPPATQPAPERVAPSAARLREIAPIAGTAPVGEGELTLVAAASSALYDGRDASRGWLMETPDSLTQGAWEVPLELADDVARAAKIATGDRVRVRSGGRELAAAAFVGEDLAPGTVALRFGGGRRFAGAGASGNVMELLSPVLDPLSGELAYVQARASVARLGPGSFASVSGGSRSEERLLCLDVGLRDARAGRWPELTREGDLSAEERRRRSERAHDEHGASHASHPLPQPHGELEGTRAPDNLHELQKFPEHRWGMVVDLDRCTGCGACVVACYAENNIPVVGRDQVLKGRELSWLRIEKHVFGAGPGRQVRFLPVMCQHCAQAPCETVCPVFAAYHTPDGLNAQIYNRCIGTRYCANNCPYKVRRFNYFDWPRDDVAAQQLNPDVTVRSRGVMEKCTFCIQRIREATNRAKADARSVRDGEIQPACVQTCPTGALSFGDFKQPSWAMSRRARDPRAYRLLDYTVNTRPSVVYLRRVTSDDKA